MTNIIYRASSTETPPVTSSVKGAELTMLEFDANMKSISNDIGTRALSGVNADITEMVGLTTPLSIAQGGTESDTVDGSLFNLGVRTGPDGTLAIPSGTTAQRSTAFGIGIRYNTTLTTFEGYTGTLWGEIGGGGATGGGTDQVFVENDQVVTTDYTLSAGKNASSAGPITINTGVTVTIPTGATWVIV